MVPRTPPRHPVPVRLREREVEVLEQLPPYVQTVGPPGRLQRGIQRLGTVLSTALPALLRPHLHLLDRLGEAADGAQARLRASLQAGQARARSAARQLGDGLASAARGAAVRASRELRNVASAPPPSTSPASPPRQGRQDLLQRARRITLQLRSRLQSAARGPEAPVAHPPTDNADSTPHPRDAEAPSSSPGGALQRTLEALRARLQPHSGSPRHP